MFVVLSATLMLVDLFVAVMKVIVSVAIMQLDVSATLMQVKVSAANMQVTIFIKIMQMGFSVTSMQVVFFTVHYAHDNLYCNYAGGCFRCSHICHSFKEQLYIPFKFTFHHFSKFAAKVKILFRQNLYTNRLKESFSTFVFPIGL